MPNEKKPIKKNEHYDKETTRRAKEEQVRRGRRRMRQLIGLALSVLIIVGAVSIVQGGIELAKTYVDNTNETEAYAQRVAPLVWFDPLPFESLADADPNALKQAVIWGVLNQMGDAVEYNEFGQPQVPAVEMDLYAAKLFGPDYELEHFSFEDPAQDLSYEYDPATKLYSATATGLTPLYISTVVDIERMSGGIKRVTVGYVSTLNSKDELIATPDLSRPSKYMDYFFRRDGNEYYFYALRNNTTYVPPDSALNSSSSAAQSASLPPESLSEAVVSAASSVASPQETSSLSASSAQPESAESVASSLPQ